MTLGRCFPESSSRNRPKINLSAQPDRILRLGSTAPRREQQTPAPPRSPANSTRGVGRWGAGSTTNAALSSHQLLAAALADRDPLQASSDQERRSGESSGALRGARGEGRSGRAPRDRQTRRRTRPCLPVRSAPSPRRPPPTKMLLRLRRHSRSAPGTGTGVGQPRPRHRCRAPGTPPWAPGIPGAWAPRRRPRAPGRPGGGSPPGAPGRTARC